MMYSIVLRPPHLFFFPSHCLQNLRRGDTAPYFNLSGAVGKLLQEYTVMPDSPNPNAFQQVEEQMARNWYEFCQGATNAQGIMQAGTYFQETVRGIRSIVGQ